MARNYDTFEGYTIEYLISEDRRLKRRGFCDELQKIFESRPKETDKDFKGIDAKFFYKAIRLHPDLHYVCGEDKKIVIYEIEDTCRLSVRKLCKCLFLFKWLHIVGWKLEIIITNRYGLNKTIFPIERWGFILKKHALIKRFNESIIHGFNRL